MSAPGGVSAHNTVVSLMQRTATNRRLGNQVLSKRPLAPGSLHFHFEGAAGSGGDGRGSIAVLIDSCCDFRGPGGRISGDHKPSVVAVIRSSSGEIVERAPWDC